ncbi:hypothetical protein [Clostridium felsineum]|uniref:hypothetical protein n=1 Tax=Clostridium felsineum TaxID=36839 RepID=UPI00098CB3F7|nr:hypothetical protein [Clostridium felsineum]URZ15215.1 hypothetical protein CLFE_012330 [Clostridium felsineum DSM 794]
MSELVIGISTIDMGSARRGVNSTLDLIGTAKRNLTSALHKLETDSNSSRLRTKIDEIGKEYKAMQQLETRIDKVGKNIDYAVNKFQEVDNNCASKLKSSSYTYRKSVGLLTNKEKYGSFVGGCLDWGQAAKKKIDNTFEGIKDYVVDKWDKAMSAMKNFWDKYGNLIKNIAIIVAEVAAIALTIASGVGVIGAIGIIYSLATIVDSGEQIMGVNHSNFVEEGEKYLFGDKWGDRIYYGSSLLLGLKGGYDSFKSIGQAEKAITVAKTGVNEANTALKESREVYDAKKLAMGIKSEEKLSSAQSAASEAASNYNNIKNDANATVKQVKNAKNELEKAKDIVSSAQKQVSREEKILNKGKSIVNQKSIDLNNAKGVLSQAINAKRKSIYSTVSPFPMMYSEDTYKGVYDNFIKDSK